MSRLRVLLTNLTLASRTGTEGYVRDLAVALLRRGHFPLVYSPRLGEVAEEIRSATVPVTDNLASMSFRPDVIHGHHHPEVMTALLRYPGVPAVFVCHDWRAWHDAPPRFPRILRYVAVDDTCRDRLVLEAGIPERRVEVLLNFVDLERFRPRSPLPVRPARAVVFNNLAAEDKALPKIREACLRHGIALDVIGAAARSSSEAPEARLGAYDLVFARGRSAIEAMAVGAAVVLCGTDRFGEMVTCGNFEDLRRANFGRRRLQRSIAADAVAEEISRYDADDAARVSERVRRTASLEEAVDRWLGIYAAVVGEAASRDVDDAAEWHAAADYLREWQLQWFRLDDWLGDREAAQREIDARLAGRDRCPAEPPGLVAGHGRAIAELERLQAEVDALSRSTTVRLRNRVAALPLLGPLARALARRAVGR